MTNNELLLALSNMLDKKLEPINDRLKRMELCQENNIIPRLQNIEACYITTFERYKNSVSDYGDIKQDIDILKRVVTEHSEKLQNIS